jgi:hypothetical protein
MRIGGLDRKSLSCAKDRSAFVVYTNFSWWLSSLKKGSPRSPCFEMNQFRAAIHPVSFCTSLM